MRYYHCRKGQGTLKTKDAKPRICGKVKTPHVRRMQKKFKKVLDKPKSTRYNSCRKAKGAFHRPPQGRKKVYHDEEHCYPR